MNEDQGKEWRDVCHDPHRCAVLRQAQRLQPDHERNPHLKQTYVGSSGKPLQGWKRESRQQHQNDDVVNIPEQKTQKELDRWIAPVSEVEYPEQRP